MQSQPILAIEQAIIARLRAGMGRMVLSVDSYGGEFDEQLADVVRRFPAAWVTFAGVLSSRPTSTSRRNYLASGRFVVLVGQRSVRNEAASRQGGRNEIGVYDLVYAVRRLLTNQDLDLDGVGHLQPGAVRTIFNGQVRNVAATIFACEFDAAWIEAALEPGRWPDPEPGIPTDPDSIFEDHGGQLDTPYPDLDRVKLDHRLPTTPTDQPPDATDIVQLKKDQQP